MYEVEIKVEITKEKREFLILKLKEVGFVEKGSATQHDHYVEAIKSIHGGYDLKRYRVQGDVIFYTQKTWKMNEGVLARKEDEHEATREEFEDGVANSPNPITIHKNRQSLGGPYKNTQVHVDMDSIKFDHSPDIRHFVEAEIITSNQHEVTMIKELLRELLEFVLEEKEIVESPGMFTMAFEKK